MNLLPSIQRIQLITNNSILAFFLKFLFIKKCVLIICKYTISITVKLKDTLRCIQRITSSTPGGLFASSCFFAAFLAAASSRLILSFLIGVLSKIWWRGSITIFWRAIAFSMKYMASSSSLVRP
ncbi:unnamed protein product [Coffea canephora]|uniref:Uncharacterized protein n=1 Tax=Coffea canephora TaxID=49390 RepID=A0A068V277_COFCA|nr:unnamed protein product [Coffea canephora]